MERVAYDKRFPSARYSETMFVRAFARIPGLRFLMLRIAFAVIHIFAWYSPGETVFGLALSLAMLRGRQLAGQVLQLGLLADLPYRLA